MTSDATPSSAADTRANVIRIDDLRAPHRTPQQQAAFDYGRTLQVDLDPARLLQEAMQRTGLADLGDVTLQDRLAAQCRATDADTGLSGLGRLGVRQRLLGLLSARLRFEDYVRRNPEALDVGLEPPVIVVGLPRSGTTHLVNLRGVQRAVAAGRRERVSRAGRAHHGPRPVARRADGEHACGARPARSCRGADRVGWAVEPGRAGGAGARRRADRGPACRSRDWCRVCSAPMRRSITCIRRCSSCRRRSSRPIRSCSRRASRAIRCREIRRARRTCRPGSTIQGSRVASTPRWRSRRASCRRATCWRRSCRRRSRSGLDGVTPYPVSSNVSSETGPAYTGVVVQCASDGILDGHHVLAQLDDVKHQYGCFLETFVADGIGVVAAPAALGSDCPR